VLLKYRRGNIWFNHSENITNENKDFYISQTCCDEYKLVSYVYESEDSIEKTEIVHEHVIIR
jgi:hypothetical protein